MNPAGPPGLPGLIPRGQTITIGGSPLQQGGRVINLGSPATTPTNPPGQPVRRTTPQAKLMRLRCRFRPLHDQYIKNGVIVEDDADVIFLCGDGHQLKAHKVIMASSSKFFAKIFEDQMGKTAVVSVPDVKVDIMKLILQLTYRDRVFLTMSQIKEVGEFITIFGMAWTQFGYEEYNGNEPMTANPQGPVPMKPVELPRKVIYVSPKAPIAAGQPRRILSISPPGRSPTQPNVVNGNELDDGNQGANAQQMDRRKSRLTPRQGTEGTDEIVEQDGEDDPENLIRDWMAKLGKREGMISNGPAPKRPRLEEGVAAESSQTPNICSVCKTRFQTEIAWKWHEERHVGVNMFKCKFCDDLSKNPKLCYIHEKEVHGFSGLQQNSGTNSNQQAGQQPLTPNKLTSSTTTGGLVMRTNQAGKFVPMGQGQGHHNFKRIKLQTYKKLQKKPSPVNFINKHPQIGIGESQGSELIDVKKIKQLHWLYVCARCDNCADSAQKAVNHYNRCYPGKEKGFEETVTKFRQGFYGKSKCPLCPRRYPQNTGFMIHCGHQHQDYRRLYTHTGNSDDQLKCVNCKEAFPEPLSFHQHMDSTSDGAFYCPEEPKEEPVPENTPPVAPAPAAPTKGTVGRPPGGAKTERQPRTRRAESPIEHKAQYKVQFHTPPKSARLANRVQAEAQAEAAAAAANAEKVEKAGSSKKSTDINFPPVDCPVCGDGDLPNISLHLQTKHKELNVEVTRISSELLRCKGCTITFDICDLLDHKNCLLNIQESAEVEGDAEPDTSTTVSRRASTSTSSSAAKVVKAAAVVDMDSLPPGVGRSPIERIEIEDLHSIEAIRTALKCLVCGQEAMRLGVIADCLRTHGVHRCSLCFNSYCNKADYGLHLKKCHGAGSNKLKCPLCPKAFANAGQTSGHMYSTHWLAMLKENEQAMKTKAKTSKAKEVKEVKEDVDKVEVEGKPQAEKDEEKETSANENDSRAEEDKVMDDDKVDSSTNGTPEKSDSVGDDSKDKKQGKVKEDDDVDIE